ncbi:toxin addiction system antidote protein [Escherichia coli]|nr:toxin addiction system antidote protein [Escherichia coli]
MKQRITVTVDSDSYQLLKAYDVNISGLVSTTMQNEARRLRAGTLESGKSGRDG